MVSRERLDHSRGQERLAFLRVTEFENERNCPVGDNQEGL